jgi:hypothetical protein
MASLKLWAVKKADPQSLDHCLSFLPTKEWGESLAAMAWGISWTILRNCGSSPRFSPQSFDRKEFSPESLAQFFSACGRGGTVMRRHLKTRHFKQRTGHGKQLWQAQGHVTIQMRCIEPGVRWGMVEQR